MRTFTGGFAPIPINESRGTVNPIDICVSLGRKSRFGDQGSPEWKVLHHSALVSMLWLRLGFPPESLAYVLIHDFHEACIGDIPSPVKISLGDAVKSLEDFVDTRIQLYLGLPPPDALTHWRVKFCDVLALAIEARWFGPPNSYIDIKNNLHLTAPPTNATAQDTWVFNRGGAVVFTEIVGDTLS